MLTVTSSQMFEGIGKYADGILDHSRDYMETAIPYFYICILFILYPYFLILDLLDEFGIQINFDSPSSIQIENFAVYAYKKVVDFAPSLGGRLMNDIMSDKGTIFALISGIFAYAIMNLPAGYNIFFGLAFACLEVIDLFVQIKI